MHSQSHQIVNIVASKNCRIIDIFTDLGKLPISYIPKFREYGTWWLSWEQQLLPHLPYYLEVLSRDWFQNTNYFNCFLRWRALIQKGIPWGTGHVCTLSLVLLVSLQQHMSNSSKAKDLKGSTVCTLEKEWAIPWGLTSPVYLRSNLKFLTEDGKNIHEKQVPVYMVYNLPFHHPMKMVLLTKKNTLFFVIYEFTPKSKKSPFLVQENRQAFHGRNWRFLLWLLVEKFLHHTLSDI